MFRDAIEPRRPDDGDGADLSTRLALLLALALVATLLIGGADLWPGAY